eukprot:CAMPEP_0172541874 /NCGR_PEP_ID=MMETSP1067-20121228/12609_1 /TAXON_ID=265564 ORGANISM="Thalassiosira punctigera, Strain Tpunct2005C2" /NCGR_SAMPLE_ID=MMETSP1067 /ASSEMBLY_ACC=CAM_ASM_000444 /LENGTH=307 /DNA_ID=CAMNT_0013327999 /DNA_START=202 /DNA_END=1125 /DNA_ORIENTATION=+
MQSSDIVRKYWRRGNGGHSKHWKQLRLYHQFTTGLHNNDADDRGLNGDHHVKYSGYSSPRSFTSSSSSNTLLYSSHMTLMPILFNGNQMKTSLHCTNRAGSRSKVDFSTLGANSHSTSANSNKEHTQNQKEKDDKEMESMAASQKVRVLFKKYGAVFAGTYVGVYLTTLMAFFVSIESGVLDPETLSEIFKVSKNMACETADIVGPPGSGASMNEAADAYAEDAKTEIANDRRTLVDIITGYLQNWEWTSKYADKLSENPHLANFAVAWFLVKFTEPVRLAAAAILTPKIAKMIGRKEAKVGTDEST